jgi:hypothetical protein
MSKEKRIGLSGSVKASESMKDKNFIIEAWVRVSLVGMELYSSEERLVFASVEAFLKNSATARLMINTI